MIRSFAIAATALSLATAAMTPAQAAPITTLGECYTAVLNWCTSTFPDHADECGSSSALDECDEEFGNATARPGFGLRRTGPAISDATFRRLMAGATLLRASR